MFSKISCITLSLNFTTFLSNFPRWWLNRNKETGWEYFNLQAAQSPLETVLLKKCKKTLSQPNFVSWFLQNQKGILWSSHGSCFDTIIRMYVWYLWYFDLFTTYLLATPNTQHSTQALKPQAIISNSNPPTLSQITIWTERHQTSWTSRWEEREDGTCFWHLLWSVISSCVCEENIIAVLLFTSCDDSLT